MDWSVDPGIPVLVPRRDDNGERDHIWNLIKQHVWSKANVVEGHHLPEEGPFNRSAALNRAADLAGDWEYAVIADSDSIVYPHVLLAAVEQSKKTDRVVIVHRRWTNVARDEAEEFLETGWLEADPKRVQRSNMESSMLVVPRTVWNRVNGFDERFEGWGAEDVAFIRAVSIMCGVPLRSECDVFHLEHFRPADQAHTDEYKKNNSRWRLYVATTNHRAMKTLTAGNRVTL